MLQDLESIKQQKQHLTKLEEYLEKQYQLSLRMEQKISNLHTSPVSLTEAQLASLKNEIKQEIDALREDILKRPVTANTYKQFSVLPQSFRMEHFPMLVNTVMKWVVIMIILIFAIQVIEVYVK